MLAQRRGLRRGAKGHTISPLSNLGDILVRNGGPKCGGPRDYLDNDCRGADKKEREGVISFSKRKEPRNGGRAGELKPRNAPSCKK